MNTAQTLTQKKAYATMANRLRRDVLRATGVAGSGHPTSCLSCAEIVATLFFERMRLDLEEAESLANDHFILSKGHAAPILWAVLHEAGVLSEEELLQLRVFNSPQEGHPTPRNRWVQIATGSLGQGISAGVGMAILDKREKRASRTYVLCGDGEIAEGSFWEAASLASFEGLGNLTTIIDVNGYGQTGPTMFRADAEVYRSRLQAFGWHATVVDGHDSEALVEAYERAEQVGDKPSAIVARTVKGKGVADLEAEKGAHGKAAPDLDSALAQLPDDYEFETRLEVRRPEPSVIRRQRQNYVALTYSLRGDEAKSISPRKAFGRALEQVGEHYGDVFALDGDVSNSTYVDLWRERYPDRFLECYIAEQDMVGIAIGMSALGVKPVVSTFAAFLTRAHDQIRMAAISRANIKFAGTHVGVATGEDGPSQMGLEDLALFRSIPGSLVLQPCDGRSVFECMDLMMRHDGISYVRLFRPTVEMVPGSEEGSYRIGGSNTLRESEQDVVAILSSGITTHFALEAANELKERGIAARVIDCYCIKPMDTEMVGRVARKIGRLVVVEDHYPEGGLGESVASGLVGTGARWKHLSVGDVPRSGDAESLTRAFSIDAAAIVASAAELVEGIS